MVQLSDIYPVTDFQRNTKAHLERLARSRRPLVLTVNGKAKAVVLDARSYEKLLERLTRADMVAAVREGLEDIKHGRTKPARVFVEEMRRKYKIPRSA